MHIPDGFLNGKVSAGTGMLSLVGISFALRKLKTGLGDKRIPMLGASSAFVFAAQMVNFPIPGGASGHLLGTALCAIILGPSLGAVSLAMVLVLQCLLLHDGGLTALGANILNMSLAGVSVAWLIFSFITRVIPGKKGFHLAIVLSSWLSVIFASLMTSWELVISGTASMSVVVPAMVGFHALIGIGEAIITDLVVTFLYEVDSGFVLGFESGRRNYKNGWPQEKSRACRNIPG